MKIQDIIKNPSFLNRFWAKIEKKAPNECWEWKGSFQTTGYGNIEVKGKRFLPHRISYVIHNEDIKEGMFICHRCDNRKCVNPNHLFQGSHHDNMQDCYNKGRAAFQSTDPNKWDIGSLRRDLEYCKRGHLFDEANTGIQTKGRYCKICERDRKRRARGSRLAFEG